MCQSNMCYMSGVCVWDHLNSNLPLTILSFSSRRKTGPQLYLDTEIMETLGLGCLDARHLSLYSLFSLRILKFQCNHVQSCVKNQLSVFVCACLLRRECYRDKTYFVLINVRHLMRKSRSRKAVILTLYVLHPDTLAICAAPFCSVWTLESLDLYFLIFYKS